MPGRSGPTGTAPCANASPTGKCCTYLHVACFFFGNPPTNFYIIFINIYDMTIYDCLHVRP